MKNNISAVVLTKGEENLDKCLKSLEWCGELIVIIDVIPTEVEGSSRRFLDSLRVARNDRGKVLIFRRKLGYDFAAQRNFGLDKAKGDWVIFVDSDEVIPDELKKEILKFTQNLAIDKNCVNNYQGFLIKRKDYFLGKWLNHGETGNIKFLRLGKKNGGKWQGKVHERWEIKGNIGVLDNPILHYPHRDITSFLSKINQYTDLVVQCWNEEGRRMGWWEIIVYPTGKFIQNYILKLGFLDGVPGLIMVIMMSCHSFLARSKYWVKYSNC